MRAIHITAGTIALVAGGIALFAPKGSPLHRRAGMVFVIAMWVMTSSAVIMAGWMRPNRLNLVAGLTTFYLVSTALLTVKRNVEQSRRLLGGLMLLALMTSTYAFALAIEAAYSVSGRVDGMPRQAFYLFATIGLAGALLDARLLLARSIAGAQRIVRHLWRMGLAMWIATASFFLGQAKLFPEPIRKSGLLAIPVLIVMLFVLYSLARVFWKRRSRSALAF